MNASAGIILFRIIKQINKMEVMGKRIFITGAGSGIGRALALHLTRAGGEVVISDINDEKLGQTSRLIKPEGFLISYIIDVADRTGYEFLVSSLKKNLRLIRRIMLP